METEELVEQFVGQYGSANTRDAYARDVRQFLGLVGGKPLREITGHDVAAFRSYLDFVQWRRAGQSGRYSTSTRARKLDAVRAFIRWAEAEGVCNVPDHELTAATATDRSEYNRLRRHRRRTP